MDVLSTADLDRVAGGFVPLAILGAMLLNLDKVKAAVTGIVDGVMDGITGNTQDSSANPSY
jgi:hypothetical protein